MIVATAGHIDHGKTALVKALTGVDTDRLPEEKARGISIELGFAYVPLPDGRTIGFVDVPGHERFVRTMIAGACGIDFVLLAVAADDGVMPQTREHLAIVDLLGVRRGIVVVTKADAVTPERIREVREEIRAAVGQSALADAPMVETSAITGAGIDHLRRQLVTAAEAFSRAAVLHRRFRYAVDRAFSVAGSGTVVTGTVFRGSVVRGDRLWIVPAGTEARVRGIQMAGRAVDRVQAGERCALNLAGVERDQIARGQWLAADPTTTLRLDVELHALADAPPIAHWSPVHLHIGTADVQARIGLSGGRAIGPGAVAYAQIVCEEPVSAVVGDRIIVRDPSARRTLGGGVVVDPLPPGRRVARPLRESHRQAMATLSPDAAIAGLLASQAAGVDIERFGHAFGLEPDHRDRLVRDAGGAIVDEKPPVAIAGAAIESIKHDVVMSLARFHSESPQAAGMELAMLRPRVAPLLRAATFAALLRRIASIIGIEVVGSLARRVGHVSTANRADEILWQKVKPRMVEAGFRGLLVADLARDLRTGEATLVDFLHRKAATGDVIRVTPKRFYPKEVMDRLASLAGDVAAGSPDQAFTAATYRDHAGVNRTLAIEILECLDRLGITQRIGDARKLRARPASTASGQSSAFKASRRVAPNPALPR